MLGGKSVKNIPAGLPIEHLINLRGNCSCYGGYKERKKKKEVLIGQNSA